MAVTGILGIGLFALAERKLAGDWGFPLDDSWIHLQFARNLAAGQGFSFNPGEASAGSTAPLWTSILALLFLSPWSPLLTAKILGGLLLLVAGWLTRCLARTLGLTPGWALLAGMSVVLAPQLLWASLSGMEVTLSTGLATAGIWLHLRNWPGKPTWGSTALLTLAALARPECLILLPLALIDRWRSAREKSPFLRLCGLHALLYATLLIPWIGFNLHTLGKPLPGTFYAKVGGYGLFGALADLDLVRSAKALLLYPVLQVRELAHLAVEHSLFLAALAPLGIVAIVRPQEIGEERNSWLLPLAILGFPLLRGVLAPFQGATFQHGRYAAHLIPSLAVMGLLGGRMAWRLLSPAGVHLRRRWRCLAVWGAVLGELLLVDLKYARTYGRNVADIQRMHVAMGQWLAVHTPSAAVIATHDIGAIGFFAQRRVLDTVGLINPGVLNFLKPGVPADLGVLHFLEQEKPDYLVILPNWYPELSQRRDLFQPVHEFVLRDRTIAGGDRLVAYRTIWADDP